MSKKTAGRASNTTFVTILLFCSVLLFLLTPVLVRIAPIRAAAQVFLNGLGATDYKIAYIEAVSGMIATFLAIVGALWTQTITDRKEKRLQIKRDAIRIYSELSPAVKSIVKIVQDVENHPARGCRGNILYNGKDKAANVEIAEYFQRNKRWHPIYVSDDWRQLVLGIQERLTDDEYLLTVKTYGSLAFISRQFTGYSVGPITEKDREEDSIMFSRMYSMTSPQHALRYPIVTTVEAKSEYENLLNKIAEIAEIKVNPDENHKDEM